MYDFERGTLFTHIFVLQFNLKTFIQLYVFCNMNRTIEKKIILV